MRYDYRGGVQPSNTALSFDVGLCHTPEVFTRLDQSPLFNRQVETYERLGPRAWSDGIVPWRVTNSPLLADLEAQLIEAFKRDLNQQGGPQLTVIDVGAGSGRSGFHLARALERRGVDAKMILTDVARSNVEAMRKQPQLAELAAAGRVSCETFDALAPRALASGPVVLLAHYLFDTLPHRAFRRVGGRTSEGWVEVNTPPAVQWDFRPTEDDKEWDDEGTFLVPVGALSALECWARSFPAPLLVLAVDKGVEPKGPDEDPSLAFHESVSAGVNFAALARSLKGTWTHFGPGKPSSIISLQAFGRGTSLEHFESAWQLRGASNELLQFIEGMESVASSDSAQACIEFIDRSGADPDLVVRLNPILLGAELTEAQAQTLLQLTARAAEQHFVFPQHIDVPFNLGVLAHRLGALEFALVLYAASLREYGPHRSTLLNTARALQTLHRPQQAHEALEAVLELEPTDEKAKALLSQWFGEE